MPFFKRICCFLELKPGGYIIGALGVIWPVILFILTEVLKKCRSEAECSQNVPFLISMCSFVLTNLLLIISIFLRARFLLIQWLLMYAFSIGGAFIFLVVNFDRIVLFFIPVVLLIFVPFIGVHVFFWLCILSLFQQMGTTDADRNHREEDCEVENIEPPNPVSEAYFFCPSVNFYI